MKSAFGYKNHVKEDAKSKLITGYTVTDASVHDSKATDLLLNEKDRGEEFYADSAYSGTPQEKIIESKEMINRVCEKGSKGHPLTEEQKAANREKSRTRSRVEHIFGFMENSMNEMYIQSLCL
jgi:IS5 family transposase